MFGWVSANIRQLLTRYVVGAVCAVVAVFGCTTRQATCRQVNMLENPFANCCCSSRLRGEALGPPEALACLMRCESATVWLCCQLSCIVLACS
jgi:hypothetical protein